MFLLNGVRLPEGTAFEDADGNKYPPSWLAQATAEEKTAIGITEVAEGVRPNDKFYWVQDNNDGTFTAIPKLLDDREEVDKDGVPLYEKVLSTDAEGNPVVIDSTKRLVAKGLKSLFIAQVKQAAGSILANTDWMVTRKADIGTDIPESVVSYRASIRAKANELEASISAVTTVEELANLDLSFPQEQ
jgi:hypothetical protein